jgi:hypothetical protein
MLLPMLLLLSVPSINKSEVRETAKHIAGGAIKFCDFDDFLPSEFGAIEITMHLE